jgi:hypothetical protein
MADDSVLPSPSEITSLADSSVFDSKVAEMSKENLCLASTSNVDGKFSTCFFFFFGFLRQGFSV